MTKTYLILIAAAMAVTSAQPVFASTYYAQRTFAATAIQLANRQEGYNVLSVSVPKGAWVVTSKVKVFDGNGGAEITCTVPGDASTAYDNSANPGSYYMIHNNTVVQTTAKSTFITLQCSQYFIPVNAAIYVQSAEMIVQPAGVLVGQ
jgi:hypothetical protein